MTKVLCTTIGTEKPRSNGSGELVRISVDQKVHAGPKPMVGKKVVLVLGESEAVRLVRDLIGVTPFRAWQDESNLKFIRDVIRMVDFAKST